MASSIWPFSTRLMRSSTCGLIDMAVTPDVTIELRSVRRRGLRNPARRTGRAARARVAACGLALRESIGQPGVHGERATAIHYDDGGQTDREEVVLEAFGTGRESAEPVHEETVGRVRGDRAGHDADDAERGEPARESDEEREGCDELGGDRESGER